jgi:NAD(P)-dependent dehydrogenase (short-subunit alcohol dehydrogenase family)
MTLEEWRRVMSVNLEGVLLGTKHGIRAMRKHGCGGSIVNVSSVSGVKASATAAAYCASKAAVCMLSRVAALECKAAGDGIRVNAVLPTGVKTPMWRTMPFFQDLIRETGSEEEAFAKMTAAGGPMDRFAEPEEVAAAVLFLASDEARIITGTELLVDDGGTA